MPIRQTKFEAGAYYHFYNRGNNRGLIFFETANYLYFLRQLRKYLSPRLDVIAYCLMLTHYHLLGRVKVVPQQTSEVLDTGVSSAMQKFIISYTKAINKRFNRVGTLFQGAFQAKPIASTPHLLHLCRYIHGNPVKDGLTADPADWPYSNYLEFIGERNGTLYDPEFVAVNFGTAAAYKAFVHADLLSRDLPQDVRKYLEDDF